MTDKEDFNKENYDGLINEMLGSHDSIKKYFMLDKVPDMTEKGILGFGCIFASPEDILAKNYINSINMQCNNLHARNYLTSVVYVNNKYSVYYLLFSGDIAYNMYCMFAARNFDPSETILYLLN